MLGALATLVWARRSKTLLLTERDRWPLWIPVLFGIGISIYFTLPIEPPYWLGLLSMIAGGVLALDRKIRTSRIPDSDRLCLVAIAAGFAARSGAHIFGSRANPQTIPVVSQDVV